MPGLVHPDSGSSARTDSPEPFLHRLHLNVLLSLASAAFMPIDMCLDEEAEEEAHSIL